MLFYLRLILVWSYLLLVMCLFIFIFLLRPFNPRNSYFLCKVICPLVLKIMGLKVIYKGAENLKKSRPCIFVGNHQDNIDIFLYSNILPKGTVCLAKKSLGLVPILGQNLWLGGHFFINRKNGESARDTMRRTRDKILSKMTSLIIFPEGTRSRKKGVGTFKKGAFRLAIDAQLPVCPIAICSLYKNINLNKWKAGKVLVEILPPIKTTGLTLDDVNNLLENTRNKIIQSIEKLDLELKSSMQLPGKALYTP